MADTFVPQVGGEHYQSNFQHWDWAAELKLGYLEGSATKYISRARFKGDQLKDLRKGLSFIDKLIKVASPTRFPHHSRRQIGDATHRFADASKLDLVERSCCFLIAAWVDSSELEAVRGLVLGLIADVEAKPVPRTEENHHAERAGKSCLLGPECPYVGWGQV